MVARLRPPASPFGPAFIILLFLDPFPAFVVKGDQNDNEHPSEN
jgi:hypothetical protein